MKTNHAPWCGRGVSTLALMVSIAIVQSDATAQTTGVNGVDHIRHHLETAFHSTGVEIDGRRLIAVDAGRAFYEQRVYQPAWTTQASILPTAFDLVGVLAGADTVGLEPRDYHLDTIRNLLTVARQLPVSSTGLLADLDLLLTDAFLAYASDLSVGLVNPKAIDSTVASRSEDGDIVEVLRHAISRDDVVASLDALVPVQSTYRRMRDAWRHYTSLAEQGDWSPISGGEDLALGKTDPRVRIIRSRLITTGDYAPTSNLSQPLEYFDETLRHALRTFQERHGLEVNGVADSVTRAELNVPAAWRARQLEINLERWRWLPRDLGARHIRVYIPGFVMEVVERDSTVLTMQIITGRTDRKTPMFSASMTYLVFNPHWYVPRSIAVQDKLPLIKNDPTYLVRQRYKVFAGYTDDAPELDPLTIDWQAVDATNFSYWLRQEPGPMNALGSVKFMFPNPLNVYMHDTPQRELFDEVRRDFSSGCVRLQQPLDLAHYLLADDAQWSDGAIERVIDTAVEMTVMLPRPMPVHLLYLTAWVDENGVIQFRRDVYEQDRTVDTALHRAQTSRRGQ